MNDKDKAKTPTEKSNMNVTNTDEAITSRELTPEELECSTGGTNADVAAMSSVVTRG
jgi:hypothetical protein